MQGANGSSTGNPNNELCDISLVQMVSTFNKESASLSFQAKVLKCILIDKRSDF